SCSGNPQLCEGRQDGMNQQDAWELQRADLRTFRELEKRVSEKKCYCSLLVVKCEPCLRRENESLGRELASARSRIEELESALRRVRDSGYVTGRAWRI